MNFTCFLYEIGLVYGQSIRPTRPSPWGTGAWAGCPGGVTRGVSAGGAGFWETVTIHGEKYFISQKIMSWICRYWNRRYRCVKNDFTSNYVVPPPPRFFLSLQKRKEMRLKLALLLLEITYAPNISTETMTSWIYYYFTFKIESKKTLRFRLLRGILPNFVLIPAWRT